jgi:hypothetical protein
MQQQELQLKAQDNQRKAAKDQADNAINAARVQVERDRIRSQADTDEKRIKMDALKTVAQMESSGKNNMMSMGVDVLKQLSNKSHEQQLREMQERMQTRNQQAKLPNKGE